MAALNAGSRAPEFTLPTVDGKKVLLQDALIKGPVVLAFFKISCPVCQYAFPFLERVYQANKGTKVTVLGISQDSLRDTHTFLDEFGVTFPVALDDPHGYKVSNAYGLTTVPSIFYIASGGEIEISSVGWSKTDLEAMNRKLADYRREAPAILWQKGEEVQDFRAG